MSMEIKGTSNVDRAIMRRAAAKAGSSGSAFSLSEQSEAQSSSLSGATGASSLTALDSILALQEVEDATEGRSKGLKRGQNLLDMLDEVRDGLLSGGIPRETLTRLAQAVSQRRDEFTDPQLQGVLDEIELRAQVELAKLEMSEKAAS